MYATNVLNDVKYAINDFFVGLDMQFVHKTLELYKKLYNTMAIDIA